MIEGWLRTQPGVQVNSLMGGSTVSSSHVTSNLTLFLDAGNLSSYPGSGTTWTDLAQGLQFSSNGTLTPFGTVGGASAFSFNGSGYWTYSANPSLVDMGGPFTLMMWLHYTSLGTRANPFEKAGNSYQSYEQEIATTWETDGTITYYSRYNTYDYGTSAALSSGWNLMALKMSTAKTGGVARTGFYSKNGAAWTSNYTARSTTAVTTSGQIRIGTGYAGTLSAGSIAIVMVYNRELTDAEVLQNHNAFRGRFGLA